MKFISKDAIVNHNSEQIGLSGGLLTAGGNFSNEDSLDWILDAIMYPLFDVDNYPTFIEKIANLTWTIITRHVFHDGNKRTGMMVLMEMCEINGYRLCRTDDDVVEVAIMIADCSALGYDIFDFIEWIVEGIEGI